MSETRSPRFPQWAAFLVFSTITLGSILEVINDPDYVVQSMTAQRWAVFSASVTFTVTLIVVLMHINAVSSILIVGTKIEGIIAAILVIFWIATVSVVTDSRRGLAVDEFGAVESGNLYYFSWAGFICSVILLVNYFRHVFNVDVATEIRTRSARLTSWSGLLATSLVVMGSSANYFDTTCGGEQDEKCSRAVFGIVLGAIMTLSSVGIVGLKIATTKAPFLIEVAVSVLSIIMYGFGVAFITSQKGPGAPLGNLYYFTWISFLVSFLIAASCYEDYNTAAATTGLDPPTTTTTTPHGGSNNVIHEDLDEEV